MDEICERIKKLIENLGLMIVPVEDIMVEDNLSELGMTSISFVTLVVSIEEEFGIEFGDENLNYSQFNTILSIAEHVEKKLSLKA
jgi:acyl carrier protein